MATYRVSISRYAKILFCTWATLFSTNARADLDSDIIYKQEINRSILSVGSAIYSTFDAVILLNFWNVLAPSPILLNTPWESTPGFPFRREFDLITNIKTWPEDAARLLFLGLVWSESKRLNLFSPTEKELELALQRVKKAGIASSNHSLNLYFTSLSNNKMRDYLEIVLRARVFEKVRGGIDKNSGLLNAPWFWHVQPQTAFKKSTDDTK